MHKRPCWVEISTSSLEHNYRLLANACNAEAEDPASPQIELLAIVKADAYGHDLSLCAPAIVRAGARWLGVTSVEEGAVARTLCPEADILVISGPFVGQGTDLIRSRLTAVVWDHWQLDELEAAATDKGAKNLPVHLELDTGMSRQGVTAANLDSILARFTAQSPLRLDALMTHLYAADESDGETTHQQLALLEAMVVRVIHSGMQPKWLHVGNSAALLAGEVPRLLKAMCARYGMKPMIRPGLALYGLTPEYSPQEPPCIAALRASLLPVLTWKTQIVSLRSIAAGQDVGYNGTFVATEPMQLALLAVGYADGLNRALSNRGFVLVVGQRAPIVGRISMDQTVVDVTGIAGLETSTGPGLGPGLGPGTEVVLLGRQGAAVISAADHARWASTIPWEIFTSITARLIRIPV